MKNTLILFFGLTILGCKSHKYSLEENSSLTLKEGFYTIIPSGVFEGKTSASVTIILDDFDKEAIVLKGFYFRNRFIEIKENSNTINGSIFLEDKIDTKTPFELENSDVVISYLQNEKQKFVKFKLRKKENGINNVPMENKN